MIKANKFQIKNLKNVIFLGYSDNFRKLKEINRDLGLKTIIISSNDQGKFIKKEKDVFIFNKFNRKFKNFILEKVETKNSIFISFGSRWIFKKDDINFFKNNLINFHCTRLPYDAGGGGFSWQILRNDRINNQLLHLIEPKIDGGRILMHEKSLFPASCKIPIDFEKYHSDKLLIFYRKFIKKVKSEETLELEKQPNYLGRYNSRLNTKISGWINWNTSSENIYKFINAFDDPYPGARTFYKNKEVILKKVHLHSGESSNHPFMSGLVSRHDKNWLVVSTTDKNMLLIESVSDSKGKDLIKIIKPGNRFYTPTKKLDLAFETKISYDSKGFKSIRYKQK